jgi:DNA-nicking Smr family endonuclease
MPKTPKNTSQRPKERNSHAISDEERDLFIKAMENCRPPLQEKSLIKPSFHTKTIKDNLSDHSLLAPVTGDAVIYFVQDGVQPRQLQRLRQGKLPIDTTLDLHGLRTEGARKALMHLLQTAVNRNWRCIHIIHGKAVLSDNPYPILKNHVNNWLRQHPDVLAFYSCPPSLGGNGAVLVLVKNR